MLNHAIRLSIRTKIAVGSLVIVLLVWGLLAIVSYSATNTLLKVVSQALFSSASKEISVEVESTYRPVMQMTALLAESRLAQGRDFESHLQSLPIITELLAQHPQAVAIMVGLDNSDYFSVRQLRRADVRASLGAPADAHYTVDYMSGDRAEEPLRQFYRHDLSMIAQIEVEDTGFDPTQRPWFQDAIKAKAAITTEPYFFYFLQTMGVTVAKRASSRRSVVATDITLDDISRYLAQQRVTPGTEILLHRDNQIVASSLAKNSENTTPRQLADLKGAVFESLVHGRSTSNRLTHRQTIPIGPNNTLELIISVPESELLAEFRQLRDRVLWWSLGLLILLVPLAWWWATGISRPIRRLSDAVATVDQADFAMDLPAVRNKDEVGVLAHALEQMSESLQRHIAELASATAARQKLESELDIARRIQMDLVPGGGELAVNVGEDSLYACLKPARAVGGDLYEMLALDDGRYFVAVGDVSDKGMPAALFMSRAVTLAKMLAPRADSPATLLAELNHELVKGNDSCMFITLICGFYTPRTGELVFSSAGHNPPVLIRNNIAQFVELNSGTAIGVFEGVEYFNQRLTLSSGDQLCIYTDGITEAFNAQREEFSEQRLINTLSSDAPLTPVKDRGEHVLEAVHAFAAGEAQSDDITLMIFGKR